MTALATSLYFFELFIPKPLPFMKIGLSNIVVLILIYNLFFKEAIFVSVAKSIIGSFLSGTLFSPAFLLSISGNLLSALVMVVVVFLLNNSFYKACLVRTPSNSKHQPPNYHLSIFGISILGSFIHLVTQLLVLRIFIIQSDTILLLYPFIAVSSIIAGFLTGLVGYYINKSIDFIEIHNKIVISKT